MKPEYKRAHTILHLAQNKQYSQFMSHYEESVNHNQAVIKTESFSKKETANINLFILNNN